MLQFNSLELWPRMIHHVVKSCCNICLPYCLNKMWIAVTKYLPDDVRPFWSKQWRFLVKKLHFCPIVQRWTLLPAPSLLLFQSRQTKSWNCVTFKAFPAFQRVLVACGAACDVRRGVRSCEAPTSKSDGSAARRAAAAAVCRRAILSFTPCSTSCTSTYIGELWVLHLNKKNIPSLYCRNLLD